MCCADIAKASGYGQRGIELYAIQDVAASVMAMMLVAYAEGLGTCWVGAFKDEEVSKVLNPGNSLRPVAIVPVGYPAKIPKPTSRVSRQEAVEFR